MKLTPDNFQQLIHVQWNIRQLAKSKNSLITSKLPVIRYPGIKNFHATDKNFKDNCHICKETLWRLGCACVLPPRVSSPYHPLVALHDMPPHAVAITVETSQICGLITTYEIFHLSAPNTHHFQRLCRFVYESEWYSHWHGPHMCRITRILCTKEKTGHGILVTGFDFRSVREAQAGRCGT